MSPTTKLVRCFRIPRVGGPVRRTMSGVVSATFLTSLILTFMAIRPPLIEGREPQTSALSGIAPVAQLTSTPTPAQLQQPGITSKGNEGGTGWPAAISIAAGAIVAVASAISSFYLGTKYTTVKNAEMEAIKRES